MCNLSECVEERGEANATARINSLNSWLFANGRMNDAIKAANDPSYQKKLMAEMKEAKGAKGKAET